MKSFFRAIIVWLLKWQAYAIVRKYRPRVVAVTGSVGKTTTKDLIAAMLKDRFRLRVAAGGYNSEFGVPLAVLDRRVGRSVRDWVSILWHGLGLLIRRTDYPELLVLEMGADHPGDLAHLTRIAPPDVAVVTNVGTAHMENYPNPEAIAEEKGTIVRDLEPDGLAVLNFDDVKTRLMQAYAPGQVSYYGMTDEANIWPSEIEFGTTGLQAVINVRAREGGTVQQWPLKAQLLGKGQLSAVLAAFAVAYAVGVKPEQALQAAASFTPSPGRLRLFQGSGGLTIIDDTYNASPSAVLTSLEVLRGFPGPHRAILGDMRELGKGSADGHRMVGQALADWLDELVVVGDEAAQIAYAAREKGMDEAKIQLTHEAKEATGVVNRDQRGGTLLVKGSQALYLERAVEALLANPQDQKHLLQRLRDPAHQRNLARQSKVN